MAIFTPKNYIQIYNAIESYLAGKSSVYSNFNVGSRVRVFAEAVAIVSGQTNYIFYEALIEAIQVSLYDGFDFDRLGGDSASGFVEFGLNDPAEAGTAYPANISISSSGNIYLTKLPFFINLGDSKNSIIIPFAIDISEINFDDDYDASTNTPAIPVASPSNKGGYYLVTTAGTPPPPAPVEIQTAFLIGDWVISDGSLWHRATSGDVPLLAEEPGTVSNIDQGDIDTLSGFGSFTTDDYGLDYAKAATDIDGGTNEESDEARKSRWLLYINGLTRTTVNGILEAVLEVDGVQSANLIENFPQRGTNTVYVDDGTASPNPPLFEEIEKILKGDFNDKENFLGYQAAGIQMIISPPGKTEIEISIRLYIDETTQSLPSDIEELAENAVINYVNNLTLSQDVILTEITTAVQNSHKDIIDVEILAISEDAIPQTPPFENIIIDSISIAKITGVSVSSVLIPKAA